MNRSIEPVDRQIYDIMATTGWWTLPALELEIRRRYARTVLQTTISAKLRRFRGAPWNVYTRAFRWKGSTWLYSLSMNDGVERSVNGRPDVLTEEEVRHA